MKQNRNSSFSSKNMMEGKVHQFRTGKKSTEHPKGLAPEPALKKRRSVTEMQFIQDYHKRKQCLSNRLPGLRKKAKEVAVMTGVALKLQVRDEYYDSVEAGHAKEEHPTLIQASTDSSNSQPHDPQPSSEPQPSTSETAASGDIDDPILSPRAIRNEVVPDVASNPDENSVEDVTPERLVVDYRETGVQCDIIVGVPHSGGDENQCRLCGGLYDADSRTRKALWGRCDSRGCKYWVHFDCLLGKSPKLTPDLVKQMPFKCPKHK